MRQRTLSRLTVLAVGVLLAALPAVAQQERPPVGSPSLTSTTGFPHPRTFEAVPGPDAEYLELVDRFIVEADGSVVHERTSRLQVNSSLAINRRCGESMWEYDPAFESVEVVVNRTVLPSGAIVVAPANAVVDDLPAAVLGNPNWSHLRRKVIVHTGLEPGCVIEERVRVTRRKEALPFFELRQPLLADAPVKERLVELRTPRGVQVNLPRGGSGGDGKVEVGEEDGRAIARWRRSNLPGASGHLLPMSFAWAVVGVDDAGLQTWLDAQLTSVGALPEEALAVASRAAAAEPDTEKRLLKVTEVLTDALHVSRGVSAASTSWRMASLARVWSSGWATPLELAAVVAAGLRHVGFKASPSLLGTEPDFPRGLVFADRVAVAVGWPPLDEKGEAGCEVRLYDPLDTAGGVPVEQQLSWAAAPQVPLRLELGKLGCAQGAALPPREVLTVTLQVNKDGGFTGSLGLAVSGGATPHGALVRDAEALVATVASSLHKGATARHASTTEMSRASARVTAELSGSLAAPGKLELVKLALGAALGGRGLDLPPLPPREWPGSIELAGPVEDVLDVTIELPEGWSVAAAPAAAKVANRLGEVEVTTDSTAGRVHVVRRLKLLGARADVGEAAELRALLLAWRSPASRELWLRPPPSV